MSIFFKLSRTIKTGHQIKTLKGWRKVQSVTEAGAMVQEGLILFGDTVYGWKAR